eukprot:gene8423-biopygen9166
MGAPWEVCDPLPGTTWRKVFRSRTKLLLRRESIAVALAVTRAAHARARRASPARDQRTERRSRDTDTDIQHGYPQELHPTLQRYARVPPTHPPGRTRSHRVRCGPTPTPSFPEQILKYEAYCAVPRGEFLLQGNHVFTELRSHPSQPHAKAVAQNLEHVFET